MRRFALAVLAGLAATMPVAVTPGFAQSAAPPVGSPASPPAAATPPVPPKVAAPSDAQQGIRNVRETCRDLAKSEGLRGEAMRKAVSDCVVKERPDLAGREQCRLDGFAKGLRKEDLRAFVKGCVKTRG